MWQSLRFSHSILRLTLAFVFFWFGVDKFFHPEYWLNAWMPESVVTLASTLGLSAVSLIYALGVFEILVGLSLAINIFVGLFGFLAIVMLAVIPFFAGFNEVIVRDVGLIGGLLALIFWPKRPGQF